MAYLTGSSKLRCLYLNLFVLSAYMIPAVCRQAGATTAPADALPSLSLTPFDIALWPHIVATVGIYGVLVLAEGTVKPALAGSQDCPLDGQGHFCEVKSLWGPDRSVVKDHSAAWRTWSNVGNFLALGGALVGSVTDSYLSLSTQPAKDAAVDILMLTESVGVATVVTHVLKYSIRRPRPSMYQPGSFSVESQLSFPSGHTTVSAAACAAYATTFALRHPMGWGRYAVATAGVLITAFTAYGRIAGGMHFYTDVAAGALIGGAVGYLVPLAYRRRVDVHIETQTDPVGGQALHAMLRLR